MHTTLLMAPGSNFLFNEIKYLVNVNELHIRTSYKITFYKNIKSMGTLIYITILFLRSISFIDYRAINLLAYICSNHISEFKCIELCYRSPQ